MQQLHVTKLNGPSEPVVTVTSVSNSEGGEFYCADKLCAEALV